MVLAQTPQGFRYGLLQQRLCRGHRGRLYRHRRGLAGRARRASGRRRPGSQVNLKITQPGDLELAEFYLRQRAR